MEVVSVLSEQTQVKDKSVTIPHTQHHCFGERGETSKSIVMGEGGFSMFNNIWCLKQDLCPVTNIQRQHEILTGILSVWRQESLTWTRQIV